MFFQHMKRILILQNPVPMIQTSFIHYLEQFNIL